MSEQIAICTVEYQQMPEDGAFIEVRRWSAQDRTELVLEHGQLDGEGDLQTTCTILPFHYSTEEALAALGSKI